MSKKLTIEFVKGEIEKEGYKLLSKEYRNANSKLELECPEGHIYKVRYGNFQQGQRCFICKIKNQKYTYEFVKGEIEKEGYKLLSEEYKGTYEKLLLKCPKGHFYDVSYNNYKQGQRCPECYGNKKHTYEFIKGEIKKEGYKLLSKEYRNSITKLELECYKSHIFWMKYNNFQQGQRCPECYKESQKHTYEFVKGEIEKEKGYKLLSKEYKGVHTKLELECNKGHIYKVRYSDFLQGKRCPECWNEKNFSRGEKEVLEYIDSLTDTTIIPNDRSQIINPKTGNFLELDIFLPDLMKAIEYNGTYWHSFDEAIFNDNQKVVQCKEKGIDLIIIKDEDWNNNKEEIKNGIYTFIKN